MESMKIMMCGNDRVLRGMLLTVLSIAKYTDRQIELFIGTMDLSDIDKRYLPITEEGRVILESVLKEKNPESSVRLYDFGDSFKRDLINSKNLVSTYTPYAMIRLFADEIYSDIGDKLLYLDTDVILRGDISELYDIDVSDYHLAGARDYFGKIFFSFISLKYLNSGVFLFNMKRMVEDGVFPKCRKLCNEKRMLLFDQHALNIHAKHKLALNRRFNEQRKTKKNTVLRHYAMTIRWLPYFHTETVKPWDRELIRERLLEYDYEDIYEKYDLIKASSSEDLKL
jgi:lipopolysaccharide biosynthesis glycosyltransferase